MALLHHGFSIRALRLPSDRVPPELEGRIETMPGDVTDAASLQGVAEGMDAVLHAAGILEADGPDDFKRINTEGTRHLLAEAERAGIRHFVLISSISVTYSQLSPYARSKADAEAVVKAAKGLAWTLIRPTLIYDDEGGAAEFARFVRYVARYPLVVLPGGGKAMKKPVHAEDAAGLLARVLLEPRAFGKTYALAGGESLTLAEMAERIAQGLGIQRRVLRLPAAIAFWGARVVQGLGSQRSGLSTRGIGLRTRRSRFRKQAIATFQGMLGLLQDAAPDTRAIAEDFGYAPRAFLPSPAALHAAAGKGHPRA